MFFNVSNTFELDTVGFSGRHWVNSNSPEWHETIQRKKSNCDVIRKIRRTEYDVII